MKQLPPLPTVQRPAGHEPHGSELNALIRAAEQRVQARDERVRQYSAALSDGLRTKGTNAAIVGAAGLVAVLAVRLLWQRRGSSRSTDQHRGRRHHSEPQMSAPAKLAWLGPVLMFLMRSPLPSYLAEMRAEQRARSAAERSRAGQQRSPERETHRANGR